MPNPIPSAAAIAFDQSKVLLVREGEGSRHLTGMYGLPSGEVEEGETEQEAAAREFREETGLFAESKDLDEFEGNLYHADIPRKDGSIKSFSWHVFLVKKFEGTLKGDDKTMPEWIEIEKLEELEKQGRLLPNTSNAVHAALSRIAKV